MLLERVYVKTLCLLKNKKGEDTHIFLSNNDISLNKIKDSLIYNGAADCIVCLLVRYVYLREEILETISNVCHNFKSLTR